MIKSGRVLLFIKKKREMKQIFKEHSVQFSSISEQCPIFCDSMDAACQDSLVPHQFPEFTQTRVHWVGNAIQPSHPLPCPYPTAFYLSQHLGSFQMSYFFTSGGQSIGVSASASVLPMNIHDRIPLGWTGWMSLQSKGFSKVFFSTIVQKQQFFSTQFSLQPNSHIHI